MSALWRTSMQSKNLFLSSSRPIGTPLSLHLKKPHRLISSSSFASTAASSSLDAAATKNYDVIIVGGGHNGLVTAAYLGKQGHKVLVLERRHQVGGAACTEEIFPSFKYSRASYLFSLFRPQIFQELDLKGNGVKFYFRDPVSSFTPLLDGRYLMMGADPSLNAREISKFSQKDAEQYAKYEAKLERLTEFFHPLLDTPIPPFGLGNTWAERMHSISTFQKVSRSAMNLGKELQDFYELMTAPASKILDRWFESEPLKSTLATDAVIGAQLSPKTPGSAYVLFHHVMGEIEGRKGAWAYVEGGMGSVSNALEKAAKKAGAEIICNAEVKEILVSEGVAKGVKLTDGREIYSKKVASNATPTLTFSKLIQSKHLSPSFLSQIKSFDTTSPVTKINLALDCLPNFACIPQNPQQQDAGKAGPQHFGTIHFVENVNQIHEAFLDAERGICSSRPVIEMTIPSSLDPTLAPPGKHVASLFVQYTPYNIAGGWTEENKRKFAERCFKLIEEYCPGFSSSILHYECLPPPELERIFGLTGGNIFHGAMGLDQLFWLRPSSAAYDNRTPIKGLYLCGAGTHPGGGVMGAPGRNAARVIEWDFSA